MGAQRIADELRTPIEQMGGAAQEQLGRSQENFDFHLQDAQNAGGAYAGPGSLADIHGFAEGQRDAEKASAGSRQLADIFGRQGMLAERYGAVPGYGPGASAFDSAILGSIGQGGFEGARKEYGGLANDYRTALGKSFDAANAARSRPAPTPTPTAPQPQEPAEDAWGGFVRGPQPDMSVDAPWLGTPRRRKEGDAYGIR